jgi:hypothetical protein
MRTTRVLTSVVLMSATFAPWALAQNAAETGAPGPLSALSSGSYGAGFTGPGNTGPGSYGPGSYGPGSGASLIPILRPRSSCLPRAEAPRCRSASATRSVVPVGQMAKLLALWGNSGSP